MTDARAPLARPSRAALVTALLGVWVVWGSTYLGIRFAIASLPPFRMAAMRLVTAGLLLYGWSRLRGAPSPTREQWRGAALVGVLLFVGGNGSVVWSEQWVESGLVAILVGAVPLWAALLGLAFGRRPTARQGAGMALGLVGVIVLDAGDGLSAAPWAAGVLALGSAAWALGSILAQRVALPKGTMGSAAEMICGGVALALLSLLTGEPWTGEVTLSSWLALAYLVLFGSILAFSAYTWLLEHASLPVATSYAYVNPVVAVLLGVLLGDERLDAHAGVGLVLVVAAVGLVMGERREAR